MRELTNGSPVLSGAHTMPAASSKTKLKPRNSQEIPPRLLVPFPKHRSTGKGFVGTGGKDTGILGHWDVPRKETSH